MVNRNLPHYAGQIIRDKCIAICGFKEEIYAGVDLDGNHCFCGSSVGDECGSVNETQCLEVCLVIQHFKTLFLIFNQLFILYIFWMSISSSTE